MKQLLLSAVIILAAILQFGCASKLEPGGAYSNTNSVGVVVSDKPFMVVDSAFSLAYAAVHAVFQYEEDNRAMLWATSHSIKQSLDRIRPQAVTARNAYFQARALYVANKTPQSLALMQAQVAKIQKLSTDAQAVLPK